MSLPTLNGTGRLTADGELRFTSAGTALWSANLAFSARRKNAAGEWEDGDKLFIRAVAFKEVAESLAESLSKGDEVTVSGRVKLSEWTDRDSGEKRSRPELLVDSIGATIRRNTVSIHKPQRSEAPRDDPWGGSTSTDDIPF